MGATYKPHKVKLIIGLLSSDARAMDISRKLLINKFGPIDYESASLDFTQSDYYNKEMGPGIKRKFLSFEKMRRLDGICKIKLLTNAIERKLSLDGRRKVNIDPGYLDLAKVVLFSTKDYTHRLYLGSGIYAEATLFYKDGRYNPWPWTYPDYKSESYLKIFGAIRELYSKEDI